MGQTISLEPFSSPPINQAPSLTGWFGTKNKTFRVANNFSAFSHIWFGFPDLHIYKHIYMQKLIFISIIHMVTNLVLEWSWETRGNVYIYCCIILHGLPQSHTLFPFLEYSSRPMFTPMGRAFGTRLRQLRKQQPCILCCKRCNLPTNKRPKIQTSMYCKICSNYFCQNDSRLCMISPWGARRRSCYGEAI